MSDHIGITKGKLWGHVTRRLFHVIVTLTFTWLVISYHTFLLRMLSLSDSRQLFFVIIFLTLFSEGIRIANGWVFFGQREFESAKLSSFAWGVIGLCVIFSFSMDPRCIYPVVFLSAFIDPLVGEVRGRVSFKQCCVITYLAALLVWFLSSLLITPWPFWYGFIVSAVSLLMAMVRWRYVDDNFTMLVVPFMILILLSYI